MQKCGEIEEDKKARRKASQRRWYQKLKSDPQRYLAWSEKRDEYERKHSRHIKSVRRKRDKKRYRKMMADPVAHEIWLAKRRERYHAKMKNPEYREKLRAVAAINNERRRQLYESNPDERERYNDAARLRNRARRDFLKATEEGRAILKKYHRKQYERIMADPERHERAKEAARDYQRRYRQTEEYREKVEIARKKRTQERKKKLYDKAYVQRPEVKERRRKNSLEWIANNTEKYKTRIARASAKREMRFRTDPTYYARVREAERKYRAIKRAVQGKPYLPRPARRIPDCYVKGQVLDRTSQYIRNNMTADQLRSADAFVLEKRIEEREWRETNNEC